MISLATTFSGIGAIEQAFLKENIAHRIVFACDNGERSPSCEIDVIANILVEVVGENKTKSILSKIKNDSQTALIDLLEVLRTLPDETLHDFTAKWYSLTRKPNNQKQTYFANYNISESSWYEDIRLLSGSKYRGLVDLFVGGSPCQAFSSNGKRGGLADTRGTLFFEYGRLISEIQPRAFIFENVQGLLVHDHGRTWEVVKDCFFRLGYNIYINSDSHGREQPLLDAQDYGIPQRRKRVYLIGIHSDCDTKTFSFPEKQTLSSKVSDYLDDHNAVDSKYYLKEKGFKFVTSNPTRARIASDVMGCQKANQQFNWNGDFIFIPFEKIQNNPNIVNAAFKGVYNGVEGVIRKFTPRECLRLMGFPDSFNIIHNDMQTYRECGNSIVVNVLQSIVKELIKCKALIN